MSLIKYWYDWFGLLPLMLMFLIPIFLILSNIPLFLIVVVFAVVSGLLYNYFAVKDQKKRLRE